MNKPLETDKLLPVREYAKSRISRRGFAVTPQYIYKLIKEHKAGNRTLDFDYVEINKAIWIVK